MRSSFYLNVVLQLLSDEMMPLSFPSNCNKTWIRNLKCLTNFTYHTNDSMNHLNVNGYYTNR